MIIQVTELFRGMLLESQGSRDVSTSDRSDRAFWKARFLRYPEIVHVCGCLQAEKVIPSICKASLP